MDIDASNEVDEVSVARVVARALSQGNTSSANFQDITDGLQELDMDNYDEEDDGTLSPLFVQILVNIELSAFRIHDSFSGIELFSTGLGDAYYPSNDMDPYLKNKDVSLLSHIIILM